MEREKPETSNLWTILGAGLTLILINSAFSFKTKQKIKQRDGHKSVWSGETENLEAAHISHNKANPHYDHPSNGRILTTEEHLLDHINRAGRNGLTISQNNWAIKMLKKRLGIE
jgi:hypothetical protein